MKIKAGSNNWKINNYKMTIDAVLGGLIGSILTVIARELLELLRESKQHKYTLQKFYFEKKLRAAEAACSVWFKTVRSYTGLGSLYEQLSADKNEDLNEDIFKTIHDNFSREMESLEDSTDDIANSIFLYLDIDDVEFFDKAPIVRMVESLSKIKNLNDKINRLYDEEDLADFTRLTAINKEIKETRNKIREEFGNYGSVVNQAKEQSLELLKSARADISKHEP